MIALRDLAKAYGGVEALRGVTFRLEPGTLCGLLGHNGAGKTTLFKAIVGLVEPDAGEIMLDDRPVGFGETALRRELGYVPETDLLDDYLTVRESLEFVAAVREVPAADRAPRIARWIEFFDLAEKRDALILECSQGMRRKVSLAAALVPEPRLLLLDEAMNGLDPTVRVRLKDELRAFCGRGGTVLFSTHVIETVETLCDRVLLLSGGELRADLQAAEWHGGGVGLERLFFSGD